MFYADGLANNDIGLEVYPHLSQILDFHIYNLVGQTELRDAVLQYATNLVECLEDVNIITFLHHITRERQSGRTRTYNSNLNAVGWCNLRQTDIAALTFVVGSETLQIANGYCWFVHFQVDTLAFALFLLRTNTTTDSG